MKYLSIALFLSFLFSCSTKKAENELKQLRFSGFTIGTPADSVIYAMGREPSKRTAGTLSYRNGLFEGLEGDVLTFSLAANKLVSADFYVGERRPDQYRQLLALFTKRYGKPIEKESERMVWQDNEAVLSLSGKDVLYVGFVRKDLAR